MLMERKKRDREAKKKQWMRIHGRVIFITEIGVENQMM
jgi:hypothetical protein